MVGASPVIPPRIKPVGLSVLMDRTHPFGRFVKDVSDVLYDCYTVILEVCRKEVKYLNQ
jgi:hypothetical protein